ncbi:Nif11 domain/cupin domain-containing protein [Cyanobium sp. NIES-981]|uniref:Nif11 domain/cupin domain-containing protein n=1 Tax=Cyanobium sp. NIES-981 TaxID=1851505 RepID=UPI000B356FCB|nr:Nif11 domain/cupin domain-containing protein [Cyanobium sp. NIES-981]
MAEAQLQQFLDKVRQLNAFVALTEADPALRDALRDCSHHHQVVALARQCGFEIGRRWGERNAPLPAGPNLLGGPCPPPGRETSEILLQGADWRLEKIHSCEATTPSGAWYDQQASEWVTLLQGSALLQFADESEPRALGPGDSVLIAPHRRHRVEATDPAPGSVWLALFFGAACAG